MKQRLCLVITIVRLGLHQGDRLEATSDSGPNAKPLSAKAII